jgi:hypothetical protein
VIIRSMATSEIILPADGSSDLRPPKYLVGGRPVGVTVADAKRHESHDEAGYPPRHGPKAA